MKFESQAPSNIALIKYMGKTQVQGNLPSNSSLSYTLNDLKSKVEIEHVVDSSELKVKWEPLNEGVKFNLSEKGQLRFTKHFEALCKSIGLSGSFIIRSSNDFPAACGLASSASSFAALTKCFGTIAREFKGIDFSTEKLSQLSQKGSGSSCRSLYSPWAIWEGEGARSVDVAYEDLAHDVVVVSGHEKQVSSSEAHLRVTTSLNFVGRAERADKRMRELLQAFESKDWKSAYEVCWAEFWDMHSLFETSRPSFGYMTKDSMSVLSLIREFWQRENDGPIVTMDAGPNVHLLWRNDQSIDRVRLQQIIASRGYEIWNTGSSL